MNLAIRREDHRYYEQDNKKKVESLESALKEVAEIIRNELRDLIKAEADAQVEGAAHPFGLTKFIDTLKTRRLEELALQALTQRPHLDPQSLANRLAPKVEDEPFLTFEEIKAALNEALSAVNAEIEKKLLVLSALESEKSAFTWLPDQRPSEEIKKELLIRQSLTRLQSERDVFEAWLADPAPLHEKIIKQVTITWTTEQRGRMLRLVRGRLKEDAEEND